MKTLSIMGKERLELIDAPFPVPADDEVIIKVAYTGICGSDFPRFFDGAVHATPQVLGHEFSGTVHSLGSLVKGIAPGDRVAVAPLVPCYSCAACANGRYSLCTKYSFIGSRRQGALAEYVAVPARNCIPIPRGVSLEHAALIEPLSVALHGIYATEVPLLGTSAAVYGTGVIGLLTIAALKSAGVSTIVAVDIDQGKLDIARTFGATDTVVNIGNNLDTFFASHSHPELSIETAGHPTTQVQAINYAAHGGVISLVGTAHRPVEFQAAQFERILRGELVVRGSWMSYSSPFPGKEWHVALSLLESNAFNPDLLISKKYHLNEGAAAFYDLKESQGRMLKVLYSVDEGKAS